MNTDDPTASAVLARAERRVREIQAKLHRWASGDPGRRFDDLYNLVADPALVLVAWDRVRSNQGARSAGVDGETVRSIRAGKGEERFLTEVCAELKARSFRPLPVRERRIPKPGTAKWRRLGIPTARDRVAQAAVKLVLEPIVEADFLPCSYGFRPNRRAHDAIAEARFLASRSYEWVVEGDIEACFDTIDHAALLARLRRRVGDKRVLRLVKAFLKAGILSEDTRLQATSTGTPQGGILSPVLANLALGVLDEHIAGQWANHHHERARRRRRGEANYRLVRYADDFLILVAGTREHAEQARDQAATVLATMGMRLSPAKTKITHIDEGLDFLGWRIQRHRKRGTDRHYVYVYPSKKALHAVMGKVKTLCRQNMNLPLEVLLYRLNPVLRGWTAYFRYGVSSATFGYLRAYAWQRVIAWLRRKHPRMSWRQLRRRYCAGGWWPATSKATMFNPAKVRVIRYRYRGATIASPWLPAG